MNSTCTYAQDDWELYALGSLPEETQEAMAAHLQSGCRECGGRWSEVQMALTAMSHLAPKVRPSTNVERKLMQAIRSGQVEKKSEWSFWKAVPWAVAFCCLLVMVWWGRERKLLESELAESRQSSEMVQQDQRAKLKEVEAKLAAAQVVNSMANKASAPVVADIKNGVEANLRQQLAVAQEQAQRAEGEKAEVEREVEELRSSLGAATARRAALENELNAARKQQKDLVAQSRPDESAMLEAELAQSKAEMQRLSEAASNSHRIEQLLLSSSLQQISLRGVVPQAGHATARALYSPQGGLLLVAEALPRLAEQKCYQLWLIRKGSPSIVSGGLITLESDGKGMLFAPPSRELSEVTALAITDEPAGGSVAARGKKLLFGAQ